MSTTRSGLLARTVTTVAAGAVLVLAPAVVTTATAADAPTSSTDRAGLAGGFIAATLVDGTHYDYPSSTYLDGGNTIDAVLALDGAGVGSATADAAMAYLAANVGLYTGTDYSSTYAGATAKTLLAVTAHGGDPTSFGGADLVARLQATYGAAEPGRFSDLPVTGCGYSQCDYSNTIGQSLAMVALTRAGAAVGADATTYLLSQQCPDGGFRNDPTAGGCTSDADATAFATQALVAVGSAAASGPAGWLVAHQGADGGLAGDGAAENANTTGVAVQAFLAAGRPAAAAAGQAYLASLQYDCSAAPPLRWGIAYSPSTRSTSTVSDSDLRATPQAALGLAGRSLLSVTSEGSADALPAFACPTPTSTSTTTPTSTSSTASSSSTSTSTSAGGSSGTTTSTPGSAPAGSTTAPAAPSDPGSTTAAAAAATTDDPSTTAAGPTGRLAQTGSDVRGAVLAGLVLLALGALAVWGSRRRGAHA